MPEDLTGRKYGLWTVLKPSDDKKYYYTCQCGGCGKIKDVNASTLRLGKSHGCLSCTRPCKKEKTSRTALEKAKQKTGQTINGWDVIEVLPEKDPKGSFLCRAICPACGKEVKVVLSRLPSIHKCSSCSRNIGELVGTISETVCVDGSKLSSIKSRVNGKLNRNSTSGANGVSPLKNGRYRAYINFRRKQYQLGSYDTIEDAITARKEAERIIYGGYLSANDGWEDALKKALAEKQK